VADGAVPGVDLVHLSARAGAVVRRIAGAAMEMQR